MSTVESVESFCIDFAFALDLKGDIQSLTLANDRDLPSDFNTIFGLVCRHLNIASLFATSTTDVPVLDFKVRWDYITDEDILKCRISIVLKQNEDFVSSLSTHWDGLLSCGEVSSQVAHTNGWCLGCVTNAYRSELFRAKLESCRCIDSLVCW